VLPPFSPSDATSRPAVVLSLPLVSNRELKVFMPFPSIFSRFHHVVSYHPLSSNMHLWYSPLLPQPPLLSVPFFLQIVPPPLQIFLTPPADTFRPQLFSEALPPVGCFSPVTLLIWFSLSLQGKRGLSIFSLVYFRTQEFVLSGSPL